MQTVSFTLCRAAGLIDGSHGFVRIDEMVIVSFAAQVPFIYGKI